MDNALDVSQAGLATVAATMASAAAGLAALAAAPPVHVPLAVDEVSTSAAARLTEHGSVLSSRASDGAAVLGAAARAVLAIAAHMAEIDLANAAALAANAPTAAAGDGPATAAAVKVDAVAADTRITPMAPRPGEFTAGLIEAGSSSSGTTFTTACSAYRAGFEACVMATRTAASTVAAGITGHTGPQLSAGLNTFASWANAMASHCDTLAQAAQAHGGRFETTQHQTPRTHQFADTRHSLMRAVMTNLQTGGMASGWVARYQGQLQQLDSAATAAGHSYQLAELPQAPPTPPPVIDIVNDTSADSPDARGPQPGIQQSDQPDGVDPGATDPGRDGVGGDGDPLADPAGTDPLLNGDTSSPLGGGGFQQVAPIAVALPAALAGALGGAVGAVTSVPKQILGAAQQVIQGAAASLGQPEDLGLDTDPLEDVALSNRRRSVRRRHGCGARRYRSRFRRGRLRGAPARQRPRRASGSARPR